MTGAWKTLNDRMIAYYAVGGSGDQGDVIQVEQDGYWDLVHFAGAFRWTQTIDAIRFTLGTSLGQTADWGNWKIPSLSGSEAHFRLSVGRPYNFDADVGLESGLPPIRLSTGNKIYIMSFGDPSSYQYINWYIIYLRRYDPPVGGAGGIDRSLYKDAVGSIVP